MANLGFRKPTNKIVVAGDPLIQELNVETATNMYPGRLVIKGTNDNDVTVCGAAGISVGWLGYEQCGNAGFQPTDVNTIYAAGAQVPVLYGGKFVINATLADNNVIVKGDRLVAAANGEVAKAAAATVTAGAAAATSVSGVTPTVTGSVGIGGIVIGIAMETVTTSGATKDILVLSLI